MLSTEDSAGRNGGMRAHPLWYKAQITKRTKTLTTSAKFQLRRRCFLLPQTQQPGHIAGLFNVQQLGLDSYLIRPNHAMIGFFIDIMDPAKAGSLNVQTSKQHKCPVSNRDFYCTNY